jgi:pilus assembly protein FimV
MLKRLTLLLAALGMLLPVAVSALGLGEIRLNSALNEPLRAEIPLISIDAEEIDVLSVKLASREQYEQAGIEQVPELRQLRFEPTTGADGKPVIRVTTRNAVAEPFLNFLIEVNWPSGRSVREYTLLLDPPTLMRGAPPVSQLPAVSEPAAARPPSVSASSTTPPSGGEYGPVIKGETLWVIAETVRPDPSISMEQVMLALQQANPEAFIRNNINLLKVGVVLRVPSRDEMTTLAADEARASAQAQAAEWEAYRGQAAESVTPAPRTETATTEAPAVEAEAPARLELVVPEKQPEAAPSAAPEGAGAQPGVGEVAELRRQLDLATEEAEARRLQNDELNNQIRELEEQVAALEKLIELSSDEMASLQQNLQQQDAVEESAPAEGEMAAAPAEGEAAEAAPAEGEQAAEAMHAEGEEQAEGEMAHAETPAASEQPAMAEPAQEEKAAEGEHAHAASGEAAHGHAEEAKPAAPPPPPPPPPAPEPGLLEDPILLGGAAVILLALIGVIVAKRRGAGKAEEEEEVAEDGSAQPFAAVEEEVEEEAASGGGLFGRLKGLFSRNKGEEVAEEAEDDVLFEAAPAAAPAASAEAMPTAEASAEEPSFEAGEATGQDVLNQFAPEGVGGQEVEGEDPLERADVFLAYGRSEQAEEVLRGLSSCSRSTARTRIAPVSNASWRTSTRRWPARPARTGSAPSSWPAASPRTTTCWPRQRLGPPRRPWPRAFPRKRKRFRSTSSTPMNSISISTSSRSTATREKARPMTVVSRSTSHRSSPVESLVTSQTRGPSIPRFPERPRPSRARRPWISGSISMVAISRYPRKARSLVVVSISRRVTRRPRAWTNSVVKPLVTSISGPPMRSRHRPRSPQPMPATNWAWISTWVT